MEGFACECGAWTLLDTPTFPERVECSACGKVLHGKVKREEPVEVPELSVREVKLLRSFGFGKLLR